MWGLGLLALNVCLFPGLKPGEVAIRNHLLSMQSAGILKVSSACHAQPLGTRYELAVHCYQAVQNFREVVESDRPDQTRVAFVKSNLAPLGRHLSTLAPDLRRFGADPKELAATLKRLRLTQSVG